MQFCKTRTYERKTVHSRVCRPFTLGPVRALYRIGHPSQAGRWTDGRAGGIDTSPNPSSNQGTAHRPSGTEGEVGANKADQAANGQRYVDASRAGCLAKVSTVISVLSREMLKRWKPFCPTSSSVGHHIARGCSTSVLFRVISQS